MPRDPIADYIEWARTKGLSEGLVRRRSSFLRAAERIMNRGLLQAKPQDISRLIRHERDRGLTDPTLYVYAGHLSAFYSWAKAHDRTRRNPVEGAAVPRRPRYLPRPIAGGPLEMAIETADDRTRVILMLACLAGLRAVEIARLRREDILDTADVPQLFVQGKGDKPRIVPLSSVLADELHRYGLPTKRGPVIRRLDGQAGQVSPSLISSLANRHLHALGITDTLHSLRHYAATVLYAETKDIRLVQEILGHASPAQTAQYAAWSRSDASSAMERLADHTTHPAPSGEADDDDTLPLFHLNKPLPPQQAADDLDPA